MNVLSNLRAQMASRISAVANATPASYTSHSQKEDDANSDTAVFARTKQLKARTGDDHDDNKNIISVTGSTSKQDAAVVRLQREMV